MNQTIRNAVLSRDDEQCRFCSMNQEEHNQEYGRGLTVHHIRPRNAGGDDNPENLLTVCRSCHRTLESAYGDLVKELVREIQSEDTQEQDFDKLYNRIDELESTIPRKTAEELR